jgi:hypothetical protein
LSRIAYILQAFSQVWYEFKPNEIIIGKSGAKFISSKAEIHRFMIEEDPPPDNQLPPTTVDKIIDFYRRFLEHAESTGMFSSVGGRRNYLQLKEGLVRGVLRNPDIFQDDLFVEAVIDVGRGEMSRYDFLRQQPGIGEFFRGYLGDSKAAQRCGLAGSYTRSSALVEI